MSLADIIALPSQGTNMRDLFAVGILFDRLNEGFVIYEIG